MKREVEVVWNCEHCGAKRIRKRVKKCPNCSKVRDENVKFYALKKKASAKASTQANTPAKANTPIKVSEPWYKKINPVYVFVILGVLVFGIGILSVANLLIPETVSIEITEMNWKRSIEVEEYRKVEESDWSVPSGGRVLYANKEIHHSEPVIEKYETKNGHIDETQNASNKGIVTGYRQLDDGSKMEVYYEPVYRDEPVYSTKFYYEIEKWVYDRSGTATGKNKNVYWPELLLAENEREGERTEQYTISGYRRGDRTKKIETYTLTYEEWSELEIGMVAKFDATSLRIIP